MAVSYISAYRLISISVGFIGSDAVIFLPDLLAPFFSRHPQDFHCHLTTSEVVGYLGGRWDTTTQRKASSHVTLQIYIYYVYFFIYINAVRKKRFFHFLMTVLTVLRAFPCRTRLADRDAAPAVEEEVSAGVSPYEHVV